MADVQGDLLIRNVFEVFNERDEEKRLALMKELYNEDAIFYESGEASFTGLEPINVRVTEVLKTIPPELLFRPSGVQEQNHDIARLAWTLSEDGGPVVLSGMDIGLLKNGRISALYMFPDAPVAGEK